MSRSSGAFHDQPGSPLDRCLICGQEPAWTLLRRGDAVVTWADDAHLADVLRDLRRRPHLPDEGIVVTEFVRSDAPS